MSENVYFSLGEERGDGVGGARGGEPCVGGFSGIERVANKVNMSTSHTPAVMSREKNQEAVSRSTFRAAKYGCLTINENCSVSLTYFEEYVVLLCY